MPTMGMSNNSLRRKQAGIAEGRDDRAVEFPVAFREHFQRHGAADLGFGARRYVGHATRRGEGCQRCSRRSGALSDLQHEVGDIGACVGIEQQDIHRQAAGLLIGVLGRTSNSAVPVRCTCAESRRPAASPSRASSAARMAACSSTELLQRRSAPSAR